MGIVVPRNDGGTTKLRVGFLGRIEPEEQRRNNTPRLSLRQAPFDKVPTGSTYQVSIRRKRTGYSTSVNSRPMCTSHSRIDVYHLGVWRGL